MWVDTNILKIGTLPNDMLDFLIYFENLIVSHNWNKKQLVRDRALAESPVIYQKRYYGEIQGVASKEYDADDNLIEKESYNIIDCCMHLFPNYEILKSELSICPGGVEQGWHIDPRVFSRFSRRIHIPITTNINAFLDIENARYHLEKYGIYEFNNIKQHRSLNLGTEIRAHIIFDIIRKDWLKLILTKNTIDVLFKNVKPTLKNNLQNPSEAINSWNTDHNFFDHVFEI